MKPIEKRFVCSQCGTDFMTSSAADVCCKPETQTFWMCGAEDCSEKHRNAMAANKCAMRDAQIAREQKAAEV